MFRHRAIIFVMLVGFTSCKKKKINLEKTFPKESQSAAGTSKPADQSLIKTITDTIKGSCCIGPPSRFKQDLKRKSGL